MFVTGLTYHNIIDREPAIADYIPDYATTLQTRIDEAKAVIDNRLRAMGYDLNLIGKKIYFCNWDNEVGSEGNPVIITITNEDAINNSLFIIKSKNSLDAFTLEDGNGINILDETTPGVINPARGFILSEITSNSSLVLTLDTPITANSICAYLTDPAIYFLHLYKSLQLIYGSMRSAPGDLFEMQMNYYSDLYENEFNSLVTYYDRNGNGVIEQGETQHLKRTRILR